MLDDVLLQRERGGDALGFLELALCAAEVGADVHARHIGCVGLAALKTEGVKAQAKQQREDDPAADAEAQPLAGEDAQRLLHEHFGGKVADEAAEHHIEEHGDELAGVRVGRLAVAVDHGKQNDTQHERAAGGHAVFEGGLEGLQGDDVADRLHTAALDDERCKNGKGDAHERVDCEHDPVTVEVAGGERLSVRDLVRDLREVAAGEDDGRGEPVRPLERAGLAGKAVDKVAHHGRDHLREAPNGKVQHEVDEGEHEEIAREARAERGKAVEKQVHQTHDGEPLENVGAVKAGLRAVGRADGERDEADGDVDEQHQRDAGEHLRAEYVLPLHRQRAHRRNGAGVVEVAVGRHCHEHAEDDRHDRAAGRRHIQHLISEARGRRGCELHAVVSGGTRHRVRRPAYRPRELVSERDGHQQHPDCAVGREQRPKAFPEAEEQRFVKG